MLDTTFYAPIKVNTPVVKGGTETYLCVSDFSNILMAYKDADGVIRSLGNSSYITGGVTYTYTNDQKVDDVVASELETEHKVTTYQNHRTRAKGVIDLLQRNIILSTQKYQIIQMIVVLL